MAKRLSWTAILISAALAACGGDDGDSSPAPMGGAGAGGMIAPVGGAGAGGARAGSGGGMAPIMCGTMTCPDAYAALTSNPALAMFANLFPKPCCADMATNTCGVKGAMAMMCRPPQPVDTTCPRASLALPIGMPPNSCCAMTPAGGLCGVDGAAFDMGCVDFDTVRTGMAAAVVTVPAAKGCGPNPAPVVMTAGAGGAGGAGGATGGAGGATGGAGGATGGAGGAAGRSGAGGAGGAGGAAGRSGAGGG